MVKANYNVIGVMSGTSLDGIDIIHATYAYDCHWAFKIHQAETFKYPENWKSILMQLVTQSLSELSAIDKTYSEYLAIVITSSPK